jgi:hypothetical protein
MLCLLTKVGSFKSTSKKEIGSEHRIKVCKKLQKSLGQNYREKCSWQITWLKKFLKT